MALSSPRTPGRLHMCEWEARRGQGQPLPSAQEWTPSLAVSWARQWEGQGPRRAHTAAQGRAINSPASVRAGSRAGASGLRAGGRRRGICGHGRPALAARSRAKGFREQGAGSAAQRGHSSPTLREGSSERPRVLGGTPSGSGLPQERASPPSAPHPPRERREGLPFSSLQGSMSRPTKTRSWITRPS